MRKRKAARRAEEAARAAMEEQVLRKAGTLEPRPAPRPRPARASAPGAGAVTATLESYVNLLDRAIGLLDAEDGDLRPFLEYERASALIIQALCEAAPLETPRLPWFSAYIRGTRTNRNIVRNALRRLAEPGMHSGGQMTPQAAPGTPPGFSAGSAPWQPYLAALLRPAAVPPALRRRAGPAEKLLE